MRFIARQRAGLLYEAHLPPEPASYAALGASQAGGCASPINIPERHAHTIKCSHKDLAATLPHLGLEAGPAARTRLYVAYRGTFPAAEAAPGCAHHICRGRWVKSIANAGSRWDK